MRRITVSVKLDAELVEWLDGYAAVRGATRTAVVELGLRELRGMASGGVPDLPAVKAARPVRRLDSFPADPVLRRAAVAERNRRIRGGS